MKKRAFVISFSTILLLLVLVWFSMFYSEKNARGEKNIFDSFAVQKAGFVADDIINDLGDILGADVNVARGAYFSSIKVTDSIEGSRRFFELNDWNAFVDANYPVGQGTALSLNLNRLIDGKAELFFSNGLQFDHSYGADGNFVHFYKTNGADAGVITYDVNVNVAGASYASSGSSAWDCDLDNDVNVNLHFADYYGHVVTSFCRQDPEDDYEYEFAFDGISGTVNVFFGNISGKRNSVKVSSGLGPNITVTVSVRAEIASPASDLVWFYDADFNYSQNDVNINRKFEFGRA